MSTQDQIAGSTIADLVKPHLPAGAAYLADVVAIAPAGLATRSCGGASRAAIAQALNILLLADLVARTPTAAAYVRDLKAKGNRLVFDHGALRTIDLDGMGALPRGRAAIARVLEPLGYRQSAVYPLDRLSMTGFSYTHQDYPEDIPQFFVSELHPDRFSEGFRAAIERITRSSCDPLDAEARDGLAALAAQGELPAGRAEALLPRLVACFQRLHDDPAVEDYEALLAESAEAAWISTEGNSFNHATNRVGDLNALVAEQRALGRAMKDNIEISGSKRVRQTAYRADPVERPFIDKDGKRIMRTVPGSFFEFIERDMLPDDAGKQKLDLSFDSSNAQGIFKMTSAGSGR